MSDRKPTCDTYSLADDRQLSLTYPADLTPAEVTEVADWLALVARKLRRLAGPTTAQEMAAAGGRARAAKMTPDERSKVASKAANTRWGNTEPERLP